MKKVLAIILMAALALSMSGCVSIYTLTKAFGNDSEPQVMTSQEPLVPTLEPSTTPATSHKAESLFENAIGDAQGQNTNGQHVDEQKEYEQIADEQNTDEQYAKEQSANEQNADNTDGLHINQILLDCLGWHLSDLEAYCGGSLPPISFEDDVVFYYALPGYWDTYLAFTYANEAENQTDDAKLVRIETCTISAFTRESISAAELKDVTGNTLSVEESDTGYFLRTEIDGAVCRFIAQSEDDPAMTNLILYEKHE